MKAGDVTDTLELALEASGCATANVRHRPRLLGNNGSSYISHDLADWFGERGEDHVRGAPNHPHTQGKIERWHLTLKNRVLVGNYYLSCALELAVEAVVERYNHARYHESLGKLTPADVYFGRDEAILSERRPIKEETLEQR